MGCTISGVERKNHERFVWIQGKPKTTCSINNSEPFSLCGKGREKSSFKSGKRSTDLGKIIIRRTTDSVRNVVAKKTKDSQKASFNSSDIKTCEALSNVKNKELCEMDRTHEAIQLKATKRCNHCRVPCSKKEDEWKKAKHISKDFEQDAAGKTCFKFYISDYNNNPTSQTSKRSTTPSVSEFYSCMQNGLHDDIIKSDQFAVSVHESFFNAFEDDCDDDDFMSPKKH